MAVAVAAGLRHIDDVAACERTRKQSSTATPKMEHDPREWFSSAMAAAFFSGRYKDVLRASIDAANGSYAVSDTPFVVGALVLSGRQDDAVAVFRAWQKTRADQPVVRVASQFFLCVAECRSGRYSQATAYAAAIVRDGKRTDALDRFFAHQAVGLLRHFTGRSMSAARHAALARQLAVEAGFPYGRLLALDLLGHALTLKGDVYSGIAVLEQSAELAEQLGLRENAGAPRTAAAAYRARFSVAGIDSRRELAGLVATLRAEDGYARRLVLSELAAQHAFHGAAAAAARCIEEASLIALPDGDRRAKIRQFVAEAIVVGMARGPAAARTKLDAARALLDASLDDALELDVLWSLALVMGLDAFDRDMHLRGHVAVLAKRTGAARATFLAAPAASRHTLDMLAEDRVAQLLDALQRDRDEARHRITTQGLYGFLPLLVGTGPARRIHLLDELALLVVEDHGDVAAMEMPGAVLVALLKAIAAGPVDKEHLIHVVWNMKTYRPDRHDSLVHTAASRLRTALGRWSSWIRITDQGYALVDGVVIQDGNAPLDRARALTVPPLPRPTAADARRLALLALVRDGQSVSTSEVAAALKISDMTALRMLAGLATEGVVVRTGRGKKTRYKVPL